MVLTIGLPAVGGWDAQFLPELLQALSQTRSGFLRVRHARRRLQELCYHGEGSVQVLHAHRLQDNNTDYVTEELPITLYVFVALYNVLLGHGSSLVLF